MRYLLFLLAIPAMADCTIQTINGSDHINTAPTKLNANFSSLNACKPQIFSGSTVPASVTGSKLGDLYVNTATGLSYQCFKTSGICTAVAASNWVLLGSGGATGNVTAAATLTSTAIVTGGGTTAVQTPSATATLDSSGNLSTPGGATFGAGGSDPGQITLGPSLVSALPTCNSGREGQRRSVTDATATTFFSVVAGSGSNHVPVVCDGTSWRIG